VIRAFWDTNVLLDVLANRVPFADPAAHLWSAIERRKMSGCVSPLSLANLNYILRRAPTKIPVRDVLKQLNRLFEIVPLTGEMVGRALKSNLKDFEDALQWESALVAKAGYLLTRNASDFPASADLPALSCDELIRRHPFLIADPGNS
jgi:predicted nucleic acid-binding protein